MIGGYLSDKPRNMFYMNWHSQMMSGNDEPQLSAHIFSSNKVNLEDTFKLAEILIHDEHELINKAVGSWLREAGKQDETRLKEFLDQHADFNAPCDF